jgi:hypothetical protein
MQVWELLDRCQSILAERGTELLCEVHEHFSMQKRLAEKGFWVYDFALPMLTLQVPALFASLNASSAFVGLQCSLLYPVLVNPVLSLIRPKTDEDKPEN